MARQTRPQHPINRLVPSALFAILALGQAASAVESYTVRSLPVPAGIDPATTTDQWAEAVSRNGNWAVFIWEVAGNPRHFLWSRVDNSLTELIVPAGYEFNIGHLGNSVNGNVYGSLEKYDVNGDTTEAWPAKASQASPTVTQFGTIQARIFSVGADDVMHGLYQPGAIASGWYPSARACTWATTTTTTPTPVTFPGTTLNGATTAAVRPWDSSTDTIWGIAFFNGAATATRAFRYTPGANALVSWDATAFHGAQADSSNWNATQGFSDGTAIWDLGNEDGGGVGNPSPKRAFWVTNIDAVGGPTQFTIPLLPGKVAISKQYGVAKLSGYTMLAGVCGEGNGNENNNTKQFVWYSNEPNTAYEFKLRVLGHTDSSTDRLSGGPTHVTTGGEIFGGGVDASEQFYSNAARRPILASPAATVSVSLSANSVPENSGTAITITATRTNHPGALTNYLLARFSVSGTATADSDYTVTGGTFSGGILTISIPVGATTAAATLTPIDNSVVSPDKTVTITPAAPTNIPDVWTTCKGFINGSGAALTIVNDDVGTNPQPVITRSGSGATKDPLTITVTFNEAVVNVASGDLTASTGTLGAITGSGATYTATWTPPAASEGTATLQIAAGAANAADDNAASLAATDLVVSYDTQAPTVSAPVLSGGSDSGAPGDGITNDNTPTVNGTAEANATVRIWDGPTAGVELGSDVANPSGNWTITAAILADGGNGLYAEATDALGNVSARVGPLGLQIDTQAPNLTLSTVPTTPTSQVGSTWGGAVEANSNVSVSRQNLTTTTTTANVTDTTWTATVTLGTGTNQVTVTAIDAAGNQTVSSTYAIFLNDGSPAVTFVERFYTLILQRPADAGGLAYWVDSLRAGALDGASLARGFVLSSEFTDRNLNDAQFVEIMYQAFFDRASDPGGLAYWTGLLAAGVLREDVLWGFIGSAEFATLSTNAGITAISPANQQISNVRSFVRRFYQRTLQREGDAGGIAYWTEHLIDGSLNGAGIAHNFFLSSEFVGRGLNDSDYVDVLYQTFFSRAADAGGKTYWLGQISAGATRLLVLDGFVYSQEFSDLCASYGIIAYSAGG